jgi:glutathione S-transferase
MPAPTHKETNMKLYYHPLSSYSQKVVMAFHEKGLTFEPSIVSLMDPNGKAEYKKINPLGKLPLFIDAKNNNRKVPESSIIIEYLEKHYPSGTKLIPDDAELARQTRFWDRLMDHYINDPMSKIFFDGMRPEGQHDTIGVKDAHDTLETMLTSLDGHLGNNNKTWLMGDTFSMADCAAAPPLAYCRMIHPFDSHKNVVAYANRLFERPSFAKCLEEAKPYMAAMKKN